MAKRAAPAQPARHSTGRPLDRGESGPSRLYAPDKVGTEESGPSRLYAPRVSRHSGAGGFRADIAPQSAHRTAAPGSGADTRESGPPRLYRP